MIKAKVTILLEEDNEKLVSKLAKANNISEDEVKRRFKTKEFPINHLIEVAKTVIADTCFDTTDGTIRPLHNDINIREITGVYKAPENNC